MSLNVKLQVYRGVLADLAALPTTGFAGVMAWTTDSLEMYVDIGSGSPGIGPGNAWQRLSAGNQVFDISDPSQLTGLTAQVGDIAVVLAGSPPVPSGTYVLTAFPASNSGNWSLVAGASIEPGSVGIVPLAGATLHEFVTYIDSSGVQHLAQPQFSDIGGTLSQTQLPASIGTGSNLTNIDLGTF